MKEHWAVKEIEELENEKEQLLDQKEREDIWRNAFGNLSDQLARLVRAKDVPRGMSNLNVLRDAHGLSPKEQLLRFNRSLIRGACEYLESHPPPDDRITAGEIFHVLRSSKHFGKLVPTRRTIEWWMESDDYNDIVEDFAIDHSPRETINQRYIRAIRKWWKENPEKKSLSYAGLARILKRGQSAVRKKVEKTDEIRVLAQERPSDL